MIEGLSHITFIVSDLDRMTALLATIFDAREIYDSGSDTHSLSKEKFFDVNGLWIAIMEGEALPQQTYNHVAFKIQPEHIGLYQKRIEAAGLNVEIGRSRITGEGQSLYFYDFDNHLFELHTGTLEERLKQYNEVTNDA